MFRAPLSPDGVTGATAAPSRPANGPAPPRVWAGGPGPNAPDARAARRVRWADRKVDLSAREFQVLEYLAQHPGHVLSRTRLYEHVWNEQMEPMSNTIDVHVKEIRRKLALAGASSVISTIRGTGYRLDQEPR